MSRFCLLIIFVFLQSFDLQCYTRNMKKVVLNTLKISIMAMLAILLAQYFSLEFPFSCGIVTILSIQSTKQETFKTATERFIAFVIAVFIALLSFSVFGYGTLGFAVYLLLYIFVCQYYKWFASMAMNSVLISHFLTFGSMSQEALTNEFTLFIIGAGMGVLANLHLHQNSDYMNELKTKSDEQIRHILERMAQRIINDVDEYDGHCFDILNELIVKAKSVSIENRKNTLLQKENPDENYILMREHQTQILYEMYKTIRKMHTTPNTAHIISEFLRKIAQEYHEYNDCESLLEEFYEIDKQMKEAVLPQNRKEFEDRARLFSLLRLIEEFLSIKKEYMRK